MARTETGSLVWKTVNLSTDRTDEPWGDDDDEVDEEVVEPVVAIGEPGDRLSSGRRFVG